MCLYDEKFLLLRENGDEILFYGTLYFVNDEKNYKPYILTPPFMIEERKTPFVFNVKSDVIKELGSNEIYELRDKPRIRSAFGKPDRLEIYIKVMSKKEIPTIRTNNYQVGKLINKGENIRFSFGDNSNLNELPKDFNIHNRLPNMIFGDNEKIQQIENLEYFEFQNFNDAYQDLIENIIERTDDRDKLKDLVDKILKEFDEKKIISKGFLATHESIINENPWLSKFIMQSLWFKMKEFIFYE